MERKKILRHLMLHPYKNSNGGTTDGRRYFYPDGRMMLKKGEIQSLFRQNGELIVRVEKGEVRAFADGRYAVETPRKNASLFNQDGSPVENAQNQEYVSSFKGGCYRIGKGHRYSLFLDDGTPVSGAQNKEFVWAYDDGFYKVGDSRGCVTLYYPNGSPVDFATKVCKIDRDQFGKFHVFEMGLRPLNPSDAKSVAYRHKISLTVINVPMFPADEHLLDFRAKFGDEMLQQFHTVDNLSDGYYLLDELYLVDINDLEGNKNALAEIVKEMPTKESKHHHLRYVDSYVSIITTLQRLL